MKWEGFPYDVFFFLGTSPLLRGITEFIEKATNDSIIFLLRSTFLGWAHNPIIEKGGKSCKIDCFVVCAFFNVESKQLLLSI